ncbi:MAG: G5 domain-containing protein [Clostridia bacterium]|nr:G5 domain-containing protein [Clostridia bacterium]
MVTKNDKKNTQFLSVHGILYTISTIVLIACVSVFLFGFASPKQITIKDGEKVISAQTTKLYVEEALAEQNIILRAGDRVSAPLNSKVKDNDEITITRGTKILLTDGGVFKEMYSCEKTLESALIDADITLSEHDEITPDLSTVVSEGLEVKITRVTIETVNEEQVMDFHETKIMRDDKQADYVNVIQEGDTGWAEATFRVTTRDGVITEKLMLSQNVIVEPVAKIVEYGTYIPNTVQTSKGPVRYKKVIQCNATAYDPSPASNGGYGGLTATGMRAQYGVIAVDPRVIPLGSKVYVESPDGGDSWVYGFAVAADTGGAIKGNKVDLCYNTKSECYQFGRRPATVYVLE